MSNKQQSNTSFGAKMFLASLVGAGIGFFANKVYQDSKKEEEKSKIKSQYTVEHNTFTKTDINDYDNLQELMTCPITQEIMNNPSILTPCGHTFEKQFIRDWVSNHRSCPLCKCKVGMQEIQINFQLKELIHYYEKNKNQTQKPTKEEINSFCWQKSQKKQEQQAPRRQQDDDLVEEVYHA